MKERIKLFFANLLKKIFEQFWLIFIVMIVVAVLDLIGLGGDKVDFGAGFVLAFLYFFGFILYNIIKPSDGIS